MNIQKHIIFQINVPFEIIATKDFIVFGRYLLVNCFSIDDINYFSVEIEDIYDSKIDATETKKMRTTKSYQFSERELPGTLHMMLSALSNNEVSGNTETVFIITLFTEIMFKDDNIINELKEYFPKWDIDNFIEQSKVPGNMSKLLRMKENMTELKEKK